MWYMIAAKAEQVSSGFKMDSIILVPVDAVNMRIWAIDRYAIGGIILNLSCHKKKPVFIKRCFFPPERDVP